MSRKVTAAITRTVTDKITLYTVPTRNRAEWELLYVISLTGNDTPAVYWYDASANVEYQVLGAKNLGAGDYVLLNNAVVVMEEDDQIRVKNSSTNSVTYIATVNLVQNTAVSYHQN
jgi:hypothetical protein